MPFGQRGNWNKSQPVFSQSTVRAIHSNQWHLCCILQEWNRNLCTWFNMVTESFILTWAAAAFEIWPFFKELRLFCLIYLRSTFCFFQGFPLPLILKPVFLYIWQKELCLIVFPADVVLSPYLVLTTHYPSLVAVRWASKKSGGSSKNLGGRSPGKRYGFKKVEGRSQYLIYISLGASLPWYVSVVECFRKRWAGHFSRRKKGRISETSWSRVVGGRAGWVSSPHHEPASCQQKLPTENVLWF